MPNRRAPLQHVRAPVLRRNKRGSRCGSHHFARLAKGTQILMAVASILLSVASKLFAGALGVAAAFCLLACGAVVSLKERSATALAEDFACLRSSVRKRIVAKGNVAAAEARIKIAKARRAEIEARIARIRLEKIRRARGRTLDY